MQRLHIVSTQSGTAALVGYKDKACSTAGDAVLRAGSEQAWEGGHAAPHTPSLFSADSKVQARLSEVCQQRKAAGQRDAEPRAVVDEVAAR